MSSIGTVAEPEGQRGQVSIAAAEVLPESVMASDSMTVRKDHKPACNEITHEIRAAMSQWVKFCQYCGKKLNSKETL